MTSASGPCLACIPVLTSSNTEQRCGSISPKPSPPQFALVMVLQYSNSNPKTGLKSLPELGGQKGSQSAELRFEAEGGVGEADHGQEEGKGEEDSCQSFHRMQDFVVL